MAFKIRRRDQNAPMPLIKVKIKKDELVAQISMSA